MEGHQPGDDAYTHAVSVDFILVMCNGETHRITYSSDTLRKYKVASKSLPCRDLRKRLFSLCLWNLRYKYDDRLRIDVEKSDTDITRESDNIQLGVMNCRYMNNKLDYVFDHAIDNKQDFGCMTET